MTFEFTLIFYAGVHVTSQSSFSNCVLGGSPGSLGTGLCRAGANIVIMHNCQLCIYT